LRLSAAAATRRQHTTLAWISPRREASGEPAPGQSAGRAMPWSLTVHKLQKAAAEG
jgi:hypothetical protein